MKRFKYTIAELICAFAMSNNVSAAEDNYIIMPFEGDTVQIVDVYTGQPIVLKCDKESEVYIWSSGRSSGSGASAMSSPVETVENTHLITEKARWYYNDWYYSVGIKTDDDTVYSKRVKLNILYSKGDVNGDAAVDKQDAALVLKYVMGSADLDEKQLDAADVQEDGKVELKDAIAILYT